MGRKYRLVTVGTRLKLGDGTVYRFTGRAKDQIIQYRYAMMLRNLDQAGQPVVARKAPPPPPPPPAVPASYLVPLYVTRATGSQRGWPEVERLLTRVNEIFEPAGVGYDPLEPSEWSEPLPLQGECPFAGELDHREEWLHLVMVPQTDGDNPVLLSCGRCCLIADKADDRTVAQGLGRLLGLTPVRDVTATDRLMAAGNGLKLSPSERHWMRWNAAGHVGQTEPLELLTLPIWAYEVESPSAHKTGRTEREVRQILEKVNVVWAQAAVQFQMQNWCHLAEGEVSAADWRQALEVDLGKLAPVVRYGTKVLHLFFLNGAGRLARAAPKNHLALIPDELELGRTWSVARALGLLLGLTELKGTDQLMGPEAENYRMSPQEILMVRWKVRTRLAGEVPDTPAQAAPAAAAAPARKVLTVPFKLHLVRDSVKGAEQTREEAKELVDAVNAIWAQAGIQFELVGLTEPNVPLEHLRETWPSGPGGRAASWASLGRASGYDPTLLNVFFVRDLPFLHDDTKVVSDQLWRGAKIMLVAERYPRQPKLMQLAVTLGVYLGLKWSREGPLHRLMTWQTDGTRLTPEEIELARTTVEANQPPAAATDLTRLTVPTRLYLANDCPFNTEQALAVVEAANDIWKQAGIAFDIRTVQTAQVPLEETFPTDTKEGGGRVATCRNLPHDPHLLNLFWTRRIHYVPSNLTTDYQAHRADRVLVVAAEYHKNSPAHTLARALAAFLYLRFAKEHPDDRLTTWRGEGKKLEPDEVKLARTQVEKLREALKGTALLEGLPELEMPIRLHRVKGRSPHTEEAVRQMAREAADVFAQANIRLKFALQESDVPEAAIEAVYPNDKGDTVRKKDASGLCQVPGYRADTLQIFLLDDVHNASKTATYVSTQMVSSKVVLMGFDKSFTFGKVLARTVAIYLGISANEFNSPGQLMGLGAGTRLTAHDVAKARAEVARLFPEGRPQPALTLPLRMKLARGETSLTEAELGAVVTRANALWASANIHFTLHSCEEVTVPANVLKDAFGAVPMGFGLMPLAGLDKHSACVFWVYSGVTAFPTSRILVVGGDTGDVLAAGVAKLLGVPWEGGLSRDDRDPARLRLRELFS